ncbi:enoyl-CoA hydratase/isomerase family protein (plasmid) [Paracoccus sp. TK19116]|uniref:Enoyl-CoA hydratase/isomerase family protein n=1 Tax=Paracoccus albicereus TaxID=2922394 RepID=A0ABT1MM42_9RHOB|nr:enoyl-CoA hydratase/isomerase family protein [Paracoccus albicereus]MCQ0969353.1 enoyl-CoA hydratase/isomerase family protein [Paracoccus albicereus]
MIRHHSRDGLAILTIDRPDRANALTAEMLATLTARLDDIAAGEDRAVILTGAGKVFSAGADLDQVREGLATSPEWERLSARVSSMPCLTVAALNGTVAGGAMGMVLACDLRVAAPGIRLFYPVMRLGLLPQPSDPRRLAGLVGMARSKMMLMAGAKITADEALAWGLVDRISADPVAEAIALAADCLSASGDHVTAIKGMIGRG